MAQTNYTPISLYYSTTASAVPTAANLVPGELAINTNDGKLYYEDSSGVVQVLATKSTGSIGGSTTQVQYNLSGSLAGSANMTFNGTTLTVNDFTDSSLTTGRVVYTTTGGNLTSSANLLYSGTDLTVYGLTVGRGGGAVASNTAIGASALTANTTASNSTAIGYQSLTTQTAGSDHNSAVGHQSGYSTTTGAQNCYFGRQAGYSNQTGNFNAFFGEQAGNATTGGSNTFIGRNAGYLVTSGAKNVIIGAYAGNIAPISATGSNFIVLSDGDGNIVASSKTAQTFALQGGTLSSGTGIAFPATQSASSDANTLDDYEEGTWTPTINGYGSAPTITYTSQSGTYTKVGRQVTVSFKVVVASSSGGSQEILVNGLPFTAGGEYVASMLSSGIDFGTLATQLTGRTESAGWIRLYGMLNNAALASTSVSTVAAGDTIQGTLTYFV